MCSDSGASEVEGCVRPTVIIMSNFPPSLRRMNYRICPAVGVLISQTGLHLQLFSKLYSTLHFSIVL